MLEGSGQERRLEGDGDDMLRADEMEVDKSPDKFTQELLQSAGEDQSQPLIEDCIVVKQENEDEREGEMKNSKFTSSKAVEETVGDDFDDMSTFGGPTPWDSVEEGAEDDFDPFDPSGASREGRSKNGGLFDGRMPWD